METLDVVASRIHLKLKCHNLYDDPVAINIDLSRAKMIYHTLQQD